MHLFDAYSYIYISGIYTLLVEVCAEYIFCLLYMLTVDLMNGESPALMVVSYAALHWESTVRDTSFLVVCLGCGPNMFANHHTVAYLSCIVRECLLVVWLIITH